MLELKRKEDFSSNRVSFKGFGFSGTAAAGQTTNVDYKITEDRLVYGGQAILQNHAIGDSISFQVVDVDNILGTGAGAVVGQYMTSWYVAADRQAQEPVIIDYPVNIPANLYLRIAYTSSGILAVKVLINIHCVKNIT